LELAVDFDDGLAGTFLNVGGLRLIVALAVSNGGMRDETAANDFALDGGFFGREEIDSLAFVERKQHLFGDGVVAIVLLENAQMAGFIEGAEEDGVGFEVAGDVGDFDVVLAGLQVERQAVANDGELLVVDGECGRQPGFAFGGVVFGCVFRLCCGLPEQPGRYDQQTHY